MRIYLFYTFFVCNICGWVGKNRILSIRSFSIPIFYCFFGGDDDERVLTMPYFPPNPKLGDRKSDHNKVVDRERKPVPACVSLKTRIMYWIDRFIWGPHTGRRRNPKPFRDIQSLEKQKEGPKRIPKNGQMKVTIKSPPERAHREVEGPNYSSLED